MPRSRYENDDPAWKPGMSKNTTKLPMYRRRRRESDSSSGSSNGTPREEEDKDWESFQPESDTRSRARSRSLVNKSTSRSRNIETPVVFESNLSSESEHDLIIDESPQMDEAETGVGQDGKDNQESHVGSTCSNFKDIYEVQKPTGIATEPPRRARSTKKKKKRKSGGNKGPKPKANKSKRKQAISDTESTISLDHDNDFVSDDDLPPPLLELQVPLGSCAIQHNGVRPCTPMAIASDFVDSEVSSMMEVEPNQNPENPNINFSSSLSSNDFTSPVEIRESLNNCVTNVLQPASIPTVNVTDQPRIDVEAETNRNPEYPNTNASSSFSYNAISPAEIQTLLNHSGTNVRGPSSIRVDNVTGLQKQQNASKNVGSSLSSTDSTSPVEIQAPFGFGITNVLEPDCSPTANVESNQTNPEDQTQNLHERCNTGSANILKPPVLSLYYNYTVGNLSNELMNIDPLSLKAGKMRLSSPNLNPLPPQPQDHGTTDSGPAYSTEEDFVLAFPKLFDCKDPVSCIASELNPEKIFELVQSFKLSGIRTVGDLSRCNSKRLEKIPIVTLPYCSKLQQARLALSNYHSDPQVKTKGEAAYENSLSAIYHYGFNGLGKGALETHSPQEVLQDNASWCPPRPEPVPSPPEVWLYPTTLQIMANTWPEPIPSSTENVAVTQTNPNGNHSESRVMRSNYATTASTDLEASDDEDTDSEARDDDDIVCLGLFPKTVQHGGVPSVPELNSAPEIEDELAGSRTEREPEVFRFAQRESTPDDSMENFDHENNLGSLGSEFSDLTMGCAAGISPKVANELTTASYSGSDLAELISPLQEQAISVFEKSARDGANEKSAETFGSSSVPPEDPYDGVKQNKGREVVISVEMESNFDVLISQNRQIGNISNAVSEPGPIEMKGGEENLELSKEYQINVDEMLKVQSLEQLPDLGAKD